MIDFLRCKQRLAWTWTKNLKSSMIAGPSVDVTTSRHGRIPVLPTRVLPKQPYLAINQPLCGHFPQERSMRCSLVSLASVH